MACRHILEHFMEIDGQRVWRVGDAKPGIQTGNNGALRSGFASELLRLPCIGSDTFVSQTVRQGRAVLPSVNVGPHSVIVHVWITAVFHAEERVSHSCLRGD